MKNTKRTYSKTTPNRHPVSGGRPGRKSSCRSRIITITKPKKSYHMHKVRGAL